MESKNHKWLPLLDLIRFSCAVWVMLYHSIQLVPAHPKILDYGNSNNPGIIFLASGWFAVTIFIVLSGYSLARGLQNRNVNWASFFAARWLRIAPLYLLVLFLSLLTSPGASADSGSIFLSLTMLPFPGAFEASPFMGTIWSVRIEVLLYLLFPALFYVASRNSARFASLLIAAFGAGLILVVWNFVPSHSILLYSTFVGRFAEFAVGFVIGFYGFRIKSRNLRFFSLAVGMALLLAGSWMVNALGGYPGMPTWARLVVGISTVIASIGLLMFADSPTTFSKPKFMRSRLVTHVLGSSYSIYIWHITIIAFLGIPFFGWLRSVGWQTSPALWLSLLLITAGTLMWSLISFLMVEKPFLSLRPRYVVDEKTRSHADHLVSK